MNDSLAIILIMCAAGVWLYATIRLRRADKEHLNYLDKVDKEIREYLNKSQIK